MRCRRSRIDADGQAVPGKELPKLTEATSDSFVSTQEGRRVAFWTVQGNPRPWRRRGCPASRPGRKSIQHPPRHRSWDSG